MGDFNLDLLKTEKNRYIKNFTNMFTSTFYPLISRPTRITSTTATLIDNIFLNNIEENYECGISFTDLSDHLPVFLNASNLQKCKHHNAIDTKSRFLIDKTINHLCQDLELERRLEKCLHSQSDAQVNAYKHFYSKLYGLFDKNIPLIKPIIMTISKFSNLIGHQQA